MTLMTYTYCCERFLVFVNETRVGLYIIIYNMKKESFLRNSFAVSYIKELLWSPFIILKLLKFNLYI